MPHRGPTGGLRRAFTLLELLLAIAVLSILTALVLPSMSGLLSDRRLQRAADLVQIELSRARLDAMRGGRVLVMTADAGSSTLTVEPYFSATDAVESTDSGATSSALLTGADQASVESGPVEPESGRVIELPDEVIVASMNVATTARSATIESTTGQAPQATPARVYFYPDGSTSDAIIQMTSPSSGDITVMIRGVTGQTLIAEPSGT
jgi:prepilin-type N-terminal cleavage/methylation domain-containing protein